MKRVSVNLKALCAYLFVFILAYLAGTYIAHFYFFLYVFMLVLGVYSILQVVLSAATIECIQAIDTENPTKGDTLRYKLWITGRPFLTTEVRIRFLPYHARLANRIPDLYITLAGKRFIERTFDIQLRHRGTYTVGIESIQISDVLGWLTLHRGGTAESFYVHPRILPLVPPTAETQVHVLSESGVNGVEQDLTMFEGLAGYREGEPIRHLAWKKYLSTGTPYLKRFGGSSEPAVVLYLDLRLPPGFPPESDVVPTTEDCSIEMAISLVRGYLERGSGVTVWAAGESLYTFTGKKPSDFQRFFDQTNDLLFWPRAPSPAQLFEADRSQTLIEASVVFVTHIIDEHLFEIVSERSRVGSRTGVFFNVTALNESEMDRSLAFGRIVRSSEAGTYHWARAETLRENLMEWQVTR